jgi:hypothetical protein
MADSRTAASIVGSREFCQRNVQTLVAMRDMSELILIDYLLAQSDRLSGGNISSYDFAYCLHGGEVTSKKASKASELPAGAPTVVVKKLTIKDTDAGLLNGNVFEKKGYLPRIRHMHPRTYEALQTFAREWNRDPAVRAFFQRECTFDEDQLRRFEKYLVKAATSLREGREGGALHLDLDLDDYFRDHGTRPAVSQLVASVGRWEQGAVNHAADVEAVQRLLAAAARTLQVRELDPGGFDGRIAQPPRPSATVAAIEAFERLCGQRGKGLIQPDSPIWQALLTAGGERPLRRGPGSPATDFPSLVGKNPDPR